MNAVETLHRIEAYFDRNHNLFIRFGGLFALVFFTLYIPFTMLNRAQAPLLAELELERASNVVLTTQLQAANQRAEFLHLSFEKKKKIMQEVECLARNIYFEAGSEPYKGKIAVAQVTMNRVNSKQFPHSVCGVVYQRTKRTCQFSWVCENKGNPRNNAAWKQSLSIAENVLINNVQYNVVGNAHYFHAVYVDPTWSNTKRVVNKIGNHIFYH
ncbi:cell wall hydrolase [bacterium]|nr:cell wall hydrolase [bacterium]